MCGMSEAGTTTATTRWPPVPSNRSRACGRCSSRAGAGAVDDASPGLRRFARPGGKGAAGAPALDRAACRHVGGTGAFKVRASMLTEERLTTALAISALQTVHNLGLELRQRHPDTNVILQFLVARYEYRSIDTPHTDSFPSPIQCPVKACSVTTTTPAQGDLTTAAISGPDLRNSTGTPPDPLLAQYHMESMELGSHPGRRFQWPRTPPNRRWYSHSGVRTLGQLRPVRPGGGLTATSSRRRMVIPSSCKDFTTSRAAPSPRQVQTGPLSKVVPQWSPDAEEVHPTLESNQGTTPARPRCRHARTPGQRGFQTSVRRPPQASCHLPLGYFPNGPGTPRQNIALIDPVKVYQPCLSCANSPPQRALGTIWGLQKEGRRPPPQSGDGL
ncbi:hypothetical protein M2266_005998 [Streptomyces sp. SPB162]|nr:hypothetical protein [Streptomyces sp. SPB162]